MRVWYVGVLGEKLDFRVKVWHDPDLWMDYYDDECRRLPLLALEIFETEPEADEYVKALNVSKSIREWVVQRNPHFVDIGPNWRAQLDESVIYLRHRIEELESENRYLKGLLRRSWDERDPSDDYGGAPCPIGPIPPQRSPGYRQSIPTG